MRAANNNYKILESKNNSLSDSLKYFEKNTSSQDGFLSADVFVLKNNGKTSIHKKGRIYQFDINKETNALEIAKKQSEGISDYLQEISEANTFNKYRLIEKIISFKTLENNWDGFEAIPTGAVCASNAIKMIDILDDKALKKVSDAYPNPQGTVTLEWENNLDEIVSAEVGKTTFSYFVDFNGLKNRFYDNQLINETHIKLLQDYISAV